MILPNWLLRWMDPPARFEYEEPKKPSCKKIEKTSYEEDRCANHRSPKVVAMAEPNSHPKCGSDRCAYWRYRVRYICENCGGMWEEEMARGDWKVEGGKVVPDHKRWTNFGQKAGV